MKKSFFLLLLFSVFLSGCVFPLQRVSPDPTVEPIAGQTVSDPPDGSSTVFSMLSEESISDLSEPDPLRLAVFWYAMADARVADLRNALLPILDTVELSYREFDAENDRYRQLEQVQSAVSAGWTVLAVNMVADGSAEAAEEIVQAAAGCPVVFFDRVPNSAEQNFSSALFSPRLAIVTMDTEEIGRTLGQMIGSWLTNHFNEADLNGDGEISFEMLLTDASDSDALAVSRECTETANSLLTTAGFPLLHYFNPENPASCQSDANALWPSDAANSIMKANLSLFNEANGNMIELVITDSDEMALGALTALQSFWYNLGDGVSYAVPLFGVGASAGAKMAVDLGQMTGIVDLNASGTASAVFDAVLSLTAEEEGPLTLFVSPVPYPVQ